MMETTQFIIMIGQAHFILHFSPLEENVHAGRHFTHLFLNPNDVKCFPFELQLANIRPGSNHDVTT